MRRAGLDLVGNFTCRVEPLWLRGHDRLLSLGIDTVTRILARDRVSPGRSVSKPAPHRLPGDPPLTAEIARILRVDHAGEFGATRIYEGQLDVLGRSRAAGAIREMAEAEKRHFARLETLLRERRVRPTLLHPLWSVAGYALGAATALLGERAAMACTVAVEEVIDEHYQRQAERLGDDDAALRAELLSFRDDEIAHRDVAIAEGAEKAPVYDLISVAVKTGSRIAIWLSTRF